MAARPAAIAFRAHPLAWTAAIVVAVAALIRIGVVIVYGPRVVGDALFYLESARALLERGPAGLAALSPISAPLYPVLLAAVSRASGMDLVTTAVTLNVVLGAATAGLLVRMAHRATGSLVASALAGAIGAAGITFLFWSVYVLTETLFLFVLALTVDRLLALHGSRRVARDGAVAAACVALLLTARPTAAAFVMAIPVWAYLTASGPRARAIRIAAAASVAAGVAFAAASMAGLLGTVGDRFGTFFWGSLWVGLQWTEQGRATGGVDIVREAPGGVFRDGVIEWMRAEPGHFFVQALRKLKVFWAPVLPEFSAFHAAVNLAYYLPLYALALIGARAGVVERRALLLLVLGIASFTLLAMVTFVDYDQRYRLPAELLLVPIAAAGVVALASAVRTERRRDARIAGRSTIT